MKLVGLCPKCHVRVFKLPNVHYVINPKGRPVHWRCLKKS